MEHKVLSWKISLFVIFGAFLSLPLEESFGYPVGSNSWHLNSPFQARINADLVCKVHVVSIRREGVIESNLFPGAPNVSRIIASAKVLSVIKGKCAQVIDIEFHYPQDGTMQWGDPPWLIYTELKEGETCLVFLKESKPYYILNRINSKARVEPKTIDYSLGDTPNLKLLAEFLAGCNSEDGMVKLQAVEELGYLGEAIIQELRPFKGQKELFQRIAFALGRAKDALSKTRSCEDLVIKNVSVISSFQVDDSPGIKAPLELLRMNPSDFDPNDSLKKYGIRDFCISSLQLRLLQTMDHTTRRAVVNLQDGSVIRREDGRPGIYRGVREFDYGQFFKQSLDCEAVKKSTEMRSAIANVIWIRYEKRSVPEMIRLLDDSSVSVRQAAVSALRKCINLDFSNSWERRHFYNPRAAKEAMRMGFEKNLEDRQKDYQNNEQEYIQYWKKWWHENKDRFLTHEPTNNGTD